MASVLEKPCSLHLVVCSCNVSGHLHILHTLIMANATVASLAFLVLCLYANLGRQRKSLHRLLLLTLAMLLGTSVAGALQLILHPCFSAALFLTFCGVHILIYWTLLYTAQRSIRCNFGGDRVSRERKRRERRRQKIYAKRQRALIFAFGGLTLKWFERILRFCVFIPTVLAIAFSGFLAILLFLHATVDCNSSWIFTISLSLTIFRQLALDCACTSLIHLGI